MIEKIEMVDEEAFKTAATPFRTLVEIRLFADKLNEVIKAVNQIKGASWGFELKYGASQCSCDDETTGGCPVHGLKY